MSAVDNDDDDDDDDDETNSRYEEEEEEEEEENASNNNNNNNTTTSAPSRRKIFRSMAPHPSILRYIQAIGVGIPERRINATRGDKTVADLERMQRGKSGYLAPPPFGPGGKPVQILGSVGIARDAAAATAPPPPKPPPPKPKRPDARQPMQEYWGNNDDEDEEEEEVMKKKKDSHKHKRQEHEDSADTAEEAIVGIGQVRHEFPRNLSLTPEIAFAGR